MKKILILGGGKMGTFIAEKLKGRYHIAIADKKYGFTHRDRSVDHISCDISHPASINFTKYDLVVNCLPGAIAMEGVEAALRAGVDCVDISFYDADPFVFSERAIDQGCVYVPDAGLAPGLTNLFTGRELAKHGTLEVASLNVGGVSQSPFAPYGYSLTWSAEDLQEDYTRPARWVSGHKIVECNPFRGIKDISVKDIQMVSFVSDGLRTLLRYKDHVDFMEECTLRWNHQHMRKVEKLIEDRHFVSEFEKNCTGIPDTVVFKCDFCANKQWKSVTMVTHRQPGWSAMAHTTGMTCVATCEAVLQGVFQKTGVQPLEELGKDELTFNFILDILALNGIQFEYERNY